LNLQVDHLHWRPLQAADLPKLLEFMQAFTEGEGNAFDAERAVRNVRYLLAHREFGGTWMIEASTTPIGYVVVTLGYSFEFGGHDSFVDEVYVLPSFRGRGIGTRTLAFAEQAAREFGATTLHLEAARRDGGPIPFYQQCGYIDRGYMLMSKPLIDS
jgi:GNAT superfamily N-acetyltransferase